MNFLKVWIFLRITFRDSRRDVLSLSFATFHAAVTGCMTSATFVAGFTARKNLHAQGVPRERSRVELLIVRFIAPSLNENEQLV